MKKAIFLDRDGVLNYSSVINGKPYPPADLKEFVIYEDAPLAVKNLKESGFFIVVVTNQPDVARGMQDVETVNAMHEMLMKQVDVDHIEICIDEKSDCYKPLPGMLLNASKRFNIDLKSSYMIGDRWRDIGAGQNAGCRKTVLLERGYKENLIYTPDYTCETLTQAVNYILKENLSD